MQFLFIYDKDTLMLLFLLPISKKKSKSVGQSDHDFVDRRGIGEKHNYYCICLYCSLSTIYVHPLTLTGD